MDSTQFNPKEFLDDFSDKSDNEEILGVKKLKSKKFDIVVNPTYSS